METTAYFKLRNNWTQMKNKLFENETTVIFSMAPSTNSQRVHRLRYCFRRVDQNSSDICCKRLNVVVIALCYSESYFKKKKIPRLWFASNRHWVLEICWPHRYLSSSRKRPWMSRQMYKSHSNICPEMLSTVRMWWTWIADSIGLWKTLRSDSLMDGDIDWKNEQSKLCSKRVPLSKTVSILFTRTKFNFFLIITYTMTKTSWQLWPFSIDEPAFAYHTVFAIGATHFQFFPTHASMLAISLPNLWNKPFHTRLTRRISSALFV